MRYRLLFTNMELGALGGTETYLYALVVNLRSRGWHVELYSPLLGRLARRLQREGFICHNRLRGDADYDLIHMHHWRNLSSVRAYYPRTPVFYMAHGLVTAEIPPPSLLPELNFIGAVSSEVKAALQRNAPGREIFVIPNSVDTKRFYPFFPLNKRKDGLRLLVLSNYPALATTEIILFLAPLLGRVTLLGRNSESLASALVVKGFSPYLLGADCWHTPVIINKHDIVISLGRGILEGLACGRVGIVFGTHGGDGMLTADNLLNSAKCNFSGRRRRLKAASTELLNSLAPLFKKDPADLARATSVLVHRQFSLERMIKHLEAVYLSILARSK